MVDARGEIMERICPVCEYPFKDGDPLVAMMLTEYKDIESDVHFAIMQPHTCLEIVHKECYGPTVEGAA
jgi:hypothetical protein